MSPDNLRMAGVGIINGSYKGFPDFLQVLIIQKYGRDYSVSWDLRLYSLYGVFAVSKQRLRS